MQTPMTTISGDNDSAKDDLRSEEGDTQTHTLHGSTPEYVRQNDGVTKIEALCKCLLPSVSSLMTLKHSRG
jgi:hypothetical protein